MLLELEGGWIEIEDTHDTVLAGYDQFVTEVQFMQFYDFEVVVPEEVLLIFWWRVFYLSFLDVFYLELELLLQDRPFVDTDTAFTC